MDDNSKAMRPSFERIDPGRLNSPGKPSAFASDDALIECASLVFSCRQPHAKPKDESGASTNSTKKLDPEWTNYFHRCITVTPVEQSKIACVMNQRRLTRLERELLIALLMSRLGLFNEDLNTCKDLLAYLRIARSQFITALRALSEDGRLFKLGLIIYDDPLEELRERQIIVNPALVSDVLAGGAGKKPGKKLKFESDLHKVIRSMMHLLENRTRILNRFYAQEQRNLIHINYAIKRVYNQIESELSLHPSWKLSALVDADLNLSQEERLMLLFLIGRELNSTNIDDAPSGADLAHVASESVEESIGNLVYLSSDCKFILAELVQPCGGSGSMLDDDDRTLASTEYELTEKAFDLFGLKKGAVKKTGKFKARPAKCSFSQLVLSEFVQRSLDMAIAQIRHGDKMIRDWGLGEVIPYGRGVTILFSGPPGTGKTACAEAIAHELDRPILVADYTQILSCWFGNTEKNIARIFREARSSNAVLFWDEADAVFYNREMAARTWEIQHENVILAEIEKYEGVCILATNRKTSMDPALERRISLKVVFERPNSTQRRDIWKRLVPQKLPLARDIDFDALAETDLSGGEIKNVVINAVRMAITRNADGPITNADFKEAIRMEQEGRLRRGSSITIGFSK